MATSFFLCNELINGSHHLQILSGDLIASYRRKDFAKIVAGAVKEAVPCKRIGVAVIGLEVPHAHIHLVPINEIGDLNFMNERKNFTDEEYRKIAERIRKNL